MGRASLSSSPPGGLIPLPLLLFRRFLRFRFLPARAPLRPLAPRPAPLRARRGPSARNRGRRESRRGLQRKRERKKKKREESSLLLLFLLPRRPSAAPPRPSAPLFRRRSTPPSPEERRGRTLARGVRRSTPAGAAGASSNLSLIGPGAASAAPWRQPLTKELPLLRRSSLPPELRGE